MPSASAAFDFQLSSDFSEFQTVGRTWVRISNTLELVNLRVIKVPFSEKTDNYPLRETDGANHLLQFGFGPMPMLTYFIPTL